MNVQLKKNFSSQSKCQILKLMTCVLLNVQFRPFYLYFICGNISVCQGCGNKFWKPPTPPYDLCLQHKEWRSFSVDNCPQTKFSPAYYHVSLFCVQRNWPMFHPANVVVTPEISIKLNQVHKDFLSSIGMMLE